MQAPELLQPSELAGSHAVHATPPMPHEPCVGGLQMLPLQQPFGHEAVLQTQAPPTHA